MGRSLEKCCRGMQRPNFPNRAVQSLATPHGTTMSKWHDFLLEHAKFPFPHPVEDRSVGTTDISQIEVGLLSREWKANHAVRDDTLVQKLCHTLKDILGETILAAHAESYLLASFWPRIQVDERGHPDEKWSTNPSEAHVSFPKDSRSSFKAKQFVLTLATESVVVK